MPSFFFFITYVSSFGKLLVFEFTHLFWFNFFEKLAAQSNQCGTEHSGQLAENYEQSKKSSDRSEEQSPVEHDTHHVLNNEHQNVDKNTENSQNKEVVLLEKNLK